MDWLMLALGGAAPFLSAPAVGCLSGAAPCSWEGPCSSSQGAVWPGRNSDREGKRREGKGLWVLMLQLRGAPLQTAAGAGDAGAPAMICS